MGGCDVDVPRVDWGVVHDNLLDDFREARDEASARITRMRKLIDALIACRPPTRGIKPEDFEVKDLVNELKTLERYIKREAERLARKEGNDA